MGFTVQDMLITAQEPYQMSMLGGEKGWSNSIDWVLMVEDYKVIQNFSGRELAVTTGLGFDSEEKLLELAEALVKKNAAGLIINSGYYIKNIPESVISYCNENDLPLIDVPWEVYIAEMIKDLSMRIYMQETADSMISQSMILAIERPDNQDDYRKELLPHFDVDGDFQVVLMGTESLDEMDTVDRKKLSNRLQIYLENITHNGIFFYYDGYFVLVVNDVTKKQLADIIENMIKVAKRRMPDIPTYMGIGSKCKDISMLHISYKRAKAAILHAFRTNQTKVEFDQMGVMRMIYQVTDGKLLEEMGRDQLLVLEEYDKKHSSNYLETLEMFLRYNGSIQAIAEALFTHRNTVMYRLTNIKKLLGTNLETPEERLPYQIAFLIRQMNHKSII